MQGKKENSRKNEINQNAVQKSMLLLLLSRISRI